jgi:hypothetical protein
MKYQLSRRDLKIDGALPRIKLIAESPEEANLLNAMESELDAAFGRGRYTLEFSGKGRASSESGQYILEYTIHPKNE